MNKSLPATVCGLLFALSGLPVGAYHIDGVQVPNPFPPPLCPMPTTPPPPNDLLCFTAVLTSADWVAEGALAVPVCESNGLQDDRVAHPFGMAGIGGLCFSGRNDASGERAPTAAPGWNNWTRIDVCDSTTVSRNNAGLLNGVAGPYANGGNYCQHDANGDGDYDDAGEREGTSMSTESLAEMAGGGLGLPARTDRHGFTLEVGAFACFIPTDGDLTTLGLPPVVAQDWAGYYREVFAWWSLEGDGTYTAPDSPGEPQTGDGPLPFLDNLDAFHGHVMVALDLSRSKSETSLVGSVETVALTQSSPLFPKGLSDTPALPGSPYGNNCGGSTSTPGSEGPVLRAPNLG